MTRFEQLTAAAFHAERVAARRLAARTSVGEEQALAATLELAAGGAGLSSLLERRSAARAAVVARVATRRQERLDARARKKAEETAPATAWRAWFDGSARPNPGRCGIGGVLKGPRGEYVEICRSAGEGNSSEAEYLALIGVLEAALAAGAPELVVHGDSRVVIDDANGADGAAAASLLAYRGRALVLIARLQAVTLRWIPRHRNGEADALSRRATRDRTPD